MLQQCTSLCSHFPLLPTSKYLIRNKSGSSLLQQIYHHLCKASICCYMSDRHSFFELRKGTTFLCRAKLLTTHGHGQKLNCGAPKLAKRCHVGMAKYSGHQQILSPLKVSKCWPSCLIAVMHNGVVLTSTMILSSQGVAGNTRGKYTQYCMCAFFLQ